MAQKSEKMDIDHIFIFSSTKGQEVDRLLDFGFCDGSSRIHPGQGTVNRKIYFENFFLEIVWVHNESEVKSPNVLKTKLWERSNFLTNGHSRFGLGFVNTPDTEELFENSIKYQPDYYSKGSQFDIITNEENFYLPWTFRVPHVTQNKKAPEPINHKNGIKKLTRATFDIKAPEIENRFTTIIERHSNILFNHGLKNLLTLEFDKGIQGEIRTIDELSLVIKY